MRAALTFIALGLPAAAFAAPPAKLDFEKAVRPLLAAKCFSCHGEEVQQSGLRLDKRQNAMRGGDYGPVIIPGHSDQSKLIKRVINGDGGMKMPPSGPLASDEIDLLKVWIDQGADYRMEIKPEAPPKPVDPRLAGLIAAVRSNATAEIQKTLAADKSLLNAKDAGGSTPLHHAAGFGSLATMKLLLDQGADVKAKNRRASTPLHWAIRDEAKVRLLLDSGAEPDIRQVDGRSPLYLASMLGNGNSILKLLLDKGADPNQATTNGNTSLINAATRGDVEAIRMLLDKKADVNAVSGTGGNALMAAASSRSFESVALLIERGANVNAVTKKSETALQNAATAGDDRSVQLLLAKGANVHTRDDRGYSALMYAAASEQMNANVVRMLLAKGADPSVEGEYETARTLAAKRGDNEVSRMLGVPEEDRKKAGIVSPPPPRAKTQPVAEAIEKGLALLEKQSHNFIRIAGCNSCHSQDLPSIASAIARDRGLHAPKSIAQLSENMNGQSPERIMDFVINSVGGGGWELVDKFANHAPRDSYTDAVAYFTKAMQTPEGYWKNPEGRRPPMNAGDFQSTAVAVATLRHYGSPESQAENKQVLARAAAWLAQQQPTANQDKALRLLALGWSGEATPATIDSAAKALIASQHEDGGWGQLPTMGSDAFASGQALYALAVAGKMPPTDPVYKKGVQYLLRTQNLDGSWHVKTRSIWTQPFFESGFPHGQDQFISSAGTAWATMALSMTIEPPRVSQR